MSDIAFRRVRGRIIPIKLNKEQKQNAQGAAYVAGGSGAALAIGKSQHVVNRFTARQNSMGARAFVASRRFEIASRIAGQSTLDGFAKTQKAAKFEGAAIRYFKTAKHAIKANMVLRPVVYAGAAAAIAAGYAKLNRNSSTAESGAVGAAGASAALGAGYFGRPYFKKLLPTLVKVVKARF